MAADDTERESTETEAAPDGGDDGGSRLGQVAKVGAVVTAVAATAVAGTKLVAALLQRRGGGEQDTSSDEDAGEARESSSGADEDPVHADDLDLATTLERAAFQAALGAASAVVERLTGEGSARKGESDDDPAQADDD